MKLNDQTHLIDKTSKLWMHPIKLVRKIDSKLFCWNLCCWSTFWWRWRLIILEMHDRVTNRLILLLDMLKNCKKNFHGWHYFSKHRHIYKVKNKNKKQTKYVGLMGGIYSNYHGHEHNPNYRIFKPKQKQKQP
jgi:hypothetical protein